MISAIDACDIAHLAASIGEEVFMDAKVLVIGMVIGGLVGWLIGKNKGLGGLGIVLGGVLGLIGWIIIAVMKGDQGQQQ
jgi:hypothetical protein